MKVKRISSILLFLFFITVISSTKVYGKVPKNENPLDNKNYGVMYGSVSLRDLLGFRKDQNIEYAGRYIDKNGLTIRFVYKSAKNISQDELRKRIKDATKKADVNIKDAQFSLKILEKYNSILVKNMTILSKYGLIGFGIDEKNNCIAVDMIKHNKDIRARISKLINIKAVRFKEYDDGFKIQF